MSTFAVVTIEGGGNLPPTISIARELAGRGHRIHVLGSRGAASAVEAAGLAFEPLEALGFWDPHVRRGVRTTVADAVRLQTDPGLADETARRLRGVGADAVLVDCLLGAPGRAAHGLGLPDAVLFHTFLAFWEGSFAHGPVGTIAALRAMPVRAIVTLGGQEPERALAGGGNVEVRARADHGELLARADLLIGHGGHSTTFRALAAGVPVLFLPMHPLLDEPMVAAAVAKAGAGAVLAKTASPARIGEAAGALLADPAARAAAERIGRRMAEQRGEAAAADELERMLAAPVRARPVD